MNLLSSSVSKTSTTFYEPDLLRSARLFLGRLFTTKITGMAAARCRQRSWRKYLITSADSAFSVVNALVYVFSAKIQVVLRTK